MAIILNLEVLIEGFTEEASAKGYFTARGITFNVTSAKGCEVSQLSLFAPSFGNAGSVLFLTKDVGLAAKVNKARKAAPSATAKLEAKIAELEAKLAAKTTAKKPVSATAKLEAKLAALEAAAAEE